MTTPIKRGGFQKGRAKTGGRKKGVPANLVLLREIVVQAADKAGGTGGVLGYLTDQAKANPTAFMSLLGRVIPLQHEGPGEDGALLIRWLPPA